MWVTTKKFNSPVQEHQLGYCQGHMEKIPCNDYRAVNCCWVVTNATCKCGNCLLSIMFSDKCFDYSCFREIWYMAAVRWRNINSTLDHLKHWDWQKTEKTFLSWIALSYRQFWIIWVFTGERKQDIKAVIACQSQSAEPPHWHLQVQNTHHQLSKTQQAASLAKT